MRKSGFSAVELIIVVVIVGIIAALGIVGYNRWNETKTAKNNADTSQQQTASAPEIKKTSDLNKATTTLDGVDFGDADATDLDTQSSAF